MSKKPRGKHRSKDELELLLEHVTGERDAAITQAAIARAADAHHYDAMRQQVAARATAEQELQAYKDRVELLESQVVDVAAGPLPEFWDTLPRHVNNGVVRLFDAEGKVVLGCWASSLWAEHNELRGKAGTLGSIDLV